MTAPLPSQPPRPSALQRWGPVVAVVAVVAVVGAVALFAGGSDDDDGGDTASGTSATSTDGAEVAVPVIWQRAEAEGTLDDHDWGERCDPETGRLRIPTVYAPPCVPVFDGDNGGATAPGVTEDTVKVVFYEPEQGNDLLSALAGQLDEPEVAMRTRANYIEMFTDLYETYGRRVELIPFPAGGAAADETAAIADAREVAQDIGAFASIGGPTLTGAYAEELARQGVLCIACGAAEPDSSYQENSPHWWGTQPTPEQYLLTVGDYVAGTLLGKPAEFAGSEDLRSRERVFGVVHFEQETPVFSDVNEEVRERGSARGYEAALTETYTLDFAVMPQRAASIIAAMKEAGVTTITFLGDPLMPGYLTEAATAQDYYPEWIVTGTVLTDTSAMARRYDQTQWSQAFGLSPLAARTPRELNDSWMLHEWYFGEPPEAGNTQAIIYAAVSQLMLGIHVAGPDLHAETFRAGLFGLPPTGGGVVRPQISYGEQGWFEAPDHLAVDDMVEIWWDAEAVGADEQGNEGPGLYRYANEGRRYLPGEIEPRESVAFVEEGTITVLDEIPEAERAPDYDAPERGAGCPPAGCDPMG